MKRFFSALLIGATLAMPINMTVCSADTECSVSNDIENTVSNDIESTVSNDIENSVRSDIESTVSNDIENSVSSDTESTVSNDTEHGVGSDTESGVSNAVVSNKKSKRQKIAKKCLTAVAFIGLGALWFLTLGVNDELHRKLNSFELEDIYQRDEEWWAIKRERKKLEISKSIQYWVKQLEWDEIYAANANIEERCEKLRKLRWKMFLDEYASAMEKSNNEEEDSVNNTGEINENYNELPALDTDARPDLEENSIMLYTPDEKVA